MPSDFVWNEAGLAHLLTSASGPVALDLARRGVNVESAMKEHASGRPGPNVQTGYLRDTIHWTLGADGSGPYVDVGTDAYYGVFLERGTSRMPPYPFVEPSLPAAII